MDYDTYQKDKQLIGKFRAALYDCDASALRGQLRKVLAPDCIVRVSTPFEEMDGPDGLFEQGYRPLLNAIPDLERRDFIVIAGLSEAEAWVGCAGHYMGVFEQPWLDIPPTRQPVAMRYHEFFRVVESRVVEMHAAWDIPQLMMQAHAWPMAPSLGVEWPAPAPATQDGIAERPYDPAKTEASVTLVRDMLTDMGKHPLRGGPEVMQLERYWHPRMNWYGPAGIGSGAKHRRFPPPTPDSLFEGAARPPGDPYRPWGDVRRWRLRGDHRFSQHADDRHRRRLAGDRADPTADHDPQPGFLALRERPDPRELGAGGSAERVQTDRCRCILTDARSDIRPPTANVNICHCEGGSPKQSRP